jgi:predicted ATPase
MPVLGLLVGSLGDTETMILVDNVEHLLGAGPLLAALLERCPRLKIVVTGRSLLRVAGIVSPGQTLANRTDTAPAP